MTPSGRMDDGVSPDSFYTYQVMFVPDLSQKYGLQISGGPGEVPRGNEHGQRLDVHRNGAVLLEG